MLNWKKTHDWGVQCIQKSLFNLIKKINANYLWHPPWCHHCHCRRSLFFTFDSPCSVHDCKRNQKTHDSLIKLYIIMHRTWIPKGPEKIKFQLSCENCIIYDMHNYSMTLNFMHNHCAFHDQEQLTLSPVMIDVPSLWLPTLFSKA